MNDGQAHLYPVTTQLLKLHSARIKKVEAHETDDPDGSDLLWLSIVDEDLTEGDLLTVIPLSEGRWMVCHDLAHKYGGWPTVWDATGSEYEVVEATGVYLSSRR